MSADYRLQQHLKMSPNAQIKNLVPETLDDVPPETEWKLGRIWYNSSIGRFQSVFSKIDEGTGLPIDPVELEVQVLGEDGENLTKINYAFKKVLGKEHTLSSKKWYEEQDGIVLHQHARDVWIDRIQEIPSDTDSRFIKAYNNYTASEDTSSAGAKTFYIRDENNLRIKGFIPTTYGIQYKIKVYIAGTLIPESHASQPLFDYTNGILTFTTTPPPGEVTVDLYEYVGRTFSQYIDAEYNSVSRGILGLDTPEMEYIIQHNMNTFDVDVVIYVFDEVNGVNYWKKDVVPMILFDENRVKLQLSEAHPIRFIIKSYETPEL